MKKFITLIVFIYGLVFSQEFKSNISIDHVPVIVNNLSEAENSFSQQGFTIKPGRKHKNGITNSHIKFKDNTEIELISISEKRDQITKEYFRFLQMGEGGTYLSLKINKADSVSAFLSRNNFSNKIIRSKLFNYIVFDDPSNKHIFLIEYKREFGENNKYLTHSNNTEGISSVYLSGNDDTIKLLETLTGKKGQIVGDNLNYKINDKKVIIIRSDKKVLHRVIKVSLLGNKNKYNLPGLKIN